MRSHEIVNSASILKRRTRCHSSVTKTRQPLSLYADWFYVNCAMVKGLFAARDNTLRDLNNVWGTHIIQFKKKTDKQTNEGTVTSSN